MMAIHTALVFIILVVLAGCGGQQERKAKYRGLAQEYIHSGNISKARIALRNVLKIDPRDAEAYFLIGQVEEKANNWRNAVANYQHVVELVPDHRGALLTLAKYYLEARLADQVIQATDKVLAKHPQDAQATALRIAVMAQQQKITDATALAEDLSQRHPTEPDVAILLATLYSHQDRLRDAEAVLRKAVEVHPHHLDLLSILQTLFVKAHDTQGAEQVLHQMIMEQPTSFDLWLRLAQFYDKNRMFDQTEMILDKMTNLFPENEQAWLALVDFLSLRRGKEAAELLFLEANRRLPSSIKIRFALASFYEKYTEDTKAQMVYQSIAKQYGNEPAGLEALVKIAALDFSAGRFGQAEQRLGAVLKKQPSLLEGLILRGRIALNQRDAKQAIQDFRAVLRDRPESVYVRFLLGQAHVLAGETQLARESFECALALFPGHQDATISLSALEMQSGQHRRAEERLDELVRNHPRHLVALEMLFSLHVRLRDWSKAQAILARLRALEGEGLVASMAEGKLFEAQKEFHKATVAYERATAVEPNALEPLIALIRLEVSQKQIERARVHLESLIAKRPDHPYGHGLLGEVLGLLEYPEQADKEFREATRINPRWVTAWLDWAALYLSIQKPELAIKILKEGLNVNTDSEELHMLLGSIFAAQGYIDLAIVAYSDVLRLNPQNLLSANNLAALLADYKGDAESLGKAFALTRDFEKYASYPLFLDTVGWVRLKMGHKEEALRIMKEAISIAPHLPALNYHLGLALFRSGNKDEAKIYISNALRSSEVFPGRREVEQLLAQMSG